MCANCSPEIFPYFSSAVLVNFWKCGSDAVDDPYCIYVQKLNCENNQFYNNIKINIFEIIKLHSENNGIM